MLLDGNQINILFLLITTQYFAAWSCHNVSIIHQWTDVSSCRLLWIKLLCCLHTGLCVDICFHFSSVNTQKYSCRVKPSVVSKSSLPHSPRSASSPPVPPHPSPHYIFTNITRTSFILVQLEGWKKKNQRHINNDRCINLFHRRFQLQEEGRLIDIKASTPLC